MNSCGVKFKREAAAEIADELLAHANGDKPTAYADALLLRSHIEGELVALERLKEYARIPMLRQKSTIMGMAAAFLSPFGDDSEAAATTAPRA